MQDNNGMQFLNGFKTVIGLLGTVAAVLVPHIAPTIQAAAPQVVDIAQGAFGLLLTLGIIHKVEKANTAK